MLEIEEANIENPLDTIIKPTEKELKKDESEKQETPKIQEDKEREKKVN